jgi:hypothetical protein
MSQPSHRNQSRQKWQQKANERAEYNRYLQKEIERIRPERDRAK